MACAECERKTKAMEALLNDLHNAETDLVAKRRQEAALRAKLTRLETGSVSAKDVESVFVAWVDLFGKDPNRTKLGEGRTKTIRARLRESFDVDSLTRALRGYVIEPLAFRGKEYTELKTLLKDEASVERGLERYANREKRPKQVTQPRPVLPPKNGDLRAVIEKLEAVDCRVTWFNQRNAGHARCPAHDDRSPSLSIAEKENGAILLNCFAGCPTEDVMRAAGLNWIDLGSPNGRSATP